MPPEAAFPESLIAALRGTFIVFDGPDGCGKTTQLELLQTACKNAGLTVRRLREPGGTSIGEQIREVLLSKKNEEMDLRCELLLYMASRAQLVTQEITPALAVGEVVLSDRYVSSTFAYQGGGGGIPFEEVAMIANFAMEKVWPTLTVIFDLPIEEAMARLHSKGAKSIRRGTSGPTTQPGLFADRIEQRDISYHERVRQGYLEQLHRWPEKYRRVDATQSVGEVQQSVEAILAEFFQK